MAKSSVTGSHTGDMKISLSTLEWTNMTTSERFEGTCRQNKGKEGVTNTAHVIIHSSAEGTKENLCPFIKLIHASIIWSMYIYAGSKCHFFS